MPEPIKILHCALEFKKGVGGIKSVTTGLLPALAATGDMELAIVTPFFDVYEGFYPDLAEIATVKHIFEGEVFSSKIFRACTDVANGHPIYHYLIRPSEDSGVAKIFCIEDELNVYKDFRHTNSNDRLKYFNGAIASMVRTEHANIPTFDIVHAHTWHTGISGCLIKEFENIRDYKLLMPAENQSLRKVPHFVSTVHMLLDVLSGWMRNPDAIRHFISSIGLPDDFIKGFPKHSKHVSEKALMRRMFSLLYPDVVTTVSEGLKNETITGRAEGLESLFETLNAEQRLYGITNGIEFAKYDGTSRDNLGEFAIDIENVSASKQKIKDHLAAKYTNLDPNKMWFVYIGRFAIEKGVDMLPHALEAIKNADANFIVMGFHVAFSNKDGVLVPTYQSTIDQVRSHDNAVVIEDAAEQRLVGNLFRAAADSMLVLSHNEACGLVPMEGMANGAICVAPNNQGLPDTVKLLSNNFASGTGFLYSDDADSRVQNLKDAIATAVKYYQAVKELGALDTLLARIMRHARKFDWSATPTDAFKALYRELMQRPVLTFDRIRNLIPTPILNAFQQHKAVKPKVFQIGFNKCGSSSLFDFFCRNGVRGVHYRFGYVASSIYDNLANNRPLLAEKYAGLQTFFDTENIYAPTPLYVHRLYKELDQQYPGSKFILNTRDKQNWLRSRTMHFDSNANKFYIDVVQEKLGLASHDEVREVWSREWDQHHAAVKEYFKDRPQDLLVFDIENDPIQKLCTFFKGLYNLDPGKMQHINKTVTRLTV